MYGLQEVCRVCIRRILREVIEKEHPNLRKIRSRQRAPKKKRIKRRGLNLVPLNMGMVILRQFEAGGRDGDNDTRPSIEDHDSDDSISDSNDNIPAEASSEDHIDEEDEFATVLTKSKFQAEKKKIMDLISEESDKESSEDEGMDEMEAGEVAGNSGDASMDNGLEQSTNERQLPEADVNLANSEHLIEDSQDVNGMYPEQTFEDSDDSENMAFDVNEMLRRYAPPRYSSPTKIRCASNTSADTSETSGIGTDDHSDPDSNKPSPGTTPESSAEAMMAHDMDSTQIKDVKDSTDCMYTYMKDKVEQLPLPIALKAYLRYYRK